MIPWVTALAFFLRQHLQKKSNVAVEEGAMTTHGLNTPVDIYKPKRKRPKAIIVFFHGMNKHGYRDPRIQLACGNLCALGYCVIAPQISSIIDLKVSAETNLQVVNVFKQIAELPIVIEMGKFAYFATSFIAYSCVYASTQEELKDKVSSGLILGGVFFPPAAFTWVLSEKEQDAYAKLIMFRAFLSDAEKRDPVVFDALTLAIDDVLEEKDFEQLKQYLSSTEMTEKQRARISQLVYDYAPPKDLSKDAYYIDAIKNLAAQLPPLELHLERLRYPVTLIHDKNDGVILSEETKNFSRLLKAHNKLHYTKITSLLEHANTKFSFFALVDLFRLTNVFSKFFYFANR